MNPEKFTNSTKLVIDDPFPDRFNLGLRICHFCLKENKRDMNSEFQRTKAMGTVHD